jgi:hypothetical protein
MSERPENVAPGGMGGATRMHDPSEAAHDRVRRRAMNVAFIVIVVLNVLQLRYVGADWRRVLLLIIAATPAGLAVKVFELRFKMAANERQQVIGELPVGKFIAYAALAVAVFALCTPLVTWALFGIWGYDFVTYYHDRPERMRHLYAVTKTLDEVREVRAPWAWALPAITWEICRRV